ncbi:MULTISPECIES: M67 family metallopeptidase [unclassified Synechocystis]|uniref:M67 family metallopeptidase n=1 Tax=unclassified Synechocystis TaxID=2640012 RepID=UPI00041D0C23|nr:MULTISPECIES: M67 family metallopeptidase [unclassified Synechocystis]AIE75165.1 Mov34/MPN/PAD-1 [Synechocystis sp. PCC 6714]MCT0252928.1 M67 family metallopeptidase [Synechocystis sp. CS-94]
MATRISLSLSQQSQIYRHAELLYPEECCGLLLGQLVTEENGDLYWQVEEVQPTENCWGQVEEFEQDYNQNQDSNLGKLHYFAIDPKVLLTAQKDCRQRSLSIIGIFHSHPHGQPIPSEFDRAIAWPEYVYLIVSGENGKFNTSRSWYLSESKNFVEVDSTLLL